jgi:hypothetical protein
MNVFDLRDRVVRDQWVFTRSLLKIANASIAARVDAWLKGEAFWSERLIELRPAFLPVDT